MTPAAMAPTATSEREQAQSRDPVADVARLGGRGAHTHQHPPGECAAGPGDSRQAQRAADGGGAARHHTQGQEQLEGKRPA